jgi:membrane protease YdiL (CAAX protease family)
LIDATLVRIVIGPALLRIAGDWNWWPGGLADARLLFGLAALRYAAVWLVGFLLVALFEEYLTRGYLQFTLTRGLVGIYRWLRAPHAEAFAFWTAALLLSFAFGLSHTANPGESPIGLLSAGLIGLVFCLSLWRTGSLWWAIGFHAAWDWAQSFLFGVADSGGVVQGRLFATHPIGRAILSGGLTGPEGSLYILPIVALHRCRHRCHAAGQDSLAATPRPSRPAQRCN